jgi:hypothetical protein
VNLDRILASHGTSDCLHSEQLAGTPLCRGWRLSAPERSATIGERCACSEPNVTLLINPYGFMGDGVLIIGGEDGPYLAAIREHRKGQVGGQQAPLVKLAVKGHEIHGHSAGSIGEGGRDLRDRGTGLAIVRGDLGAECCDRLPVGIGLGRGGRTTGREKEQDRHGEQSERDLSHWQHPQSAGQLCPLFCPHTGERPRNLAIRRDMQKVRTLKFRVLKG